MIERHFNGATSKEAVSRQNELDKYLGEQPVTFDKKFNTLNFWKDNKEKYPILCKLAKDYLALQPTSVPSERSFSQGGLTVTKTRNRQTPESVKKVMCLKSWLKVGDD